jgi:hypothetical protein
MPDSPELLAYVGRLRRITTHVDPTLPSEAARAIKNAADSLDALSIVDRTHLCAWVVARPKDAYTLGLAVGLSQEKLKNLVRARFGTMSWAKAAKDDPDALIAWLDDEFGLVAAVASQRARDYSFGDVLVARGTSRQTAASAGTAGLLIEDEVEATVRDLGLPYRMRGRFVGRNGETGPADLAIPDFEHAKITVACKGFDSTGSKLTAAVTEVQDMAGVRFADQYVFAVVDGIGWNARMGDFRRMFKLLEDGRIDGLYTLEDLPQFRVDLEQAARRVRLLP